MGYDICAVHGALDCVICNPKSTAKRPAIGPSPVIEPTDFAGTSAMTPEPRAKVVSIDRPAPSTVAQVHADGDAQTIVNAAEQYAQASDLLADYEGQLAKLESSVQQITSLISEAKMNKAKYHRALQRLLSAGQKND